MPRNFVFHDNITGLGNYGVHGPIDLASESARAMFQKNVFMNLNGISPGDYAFPPGNEIVSGIADIGFVDPSLKDFRLASNSKYKSKGRNGRNNGSDLSPQNTVSR